MMAAVAKKCAAAKVPCEVSLEAPMACGFGICLGCAIPTQGGGYLYACSEGPCVNAERIDWERSGGLAATVSKGGVK
jgi:dihydroorotate dehydrogenase electron transfer subunit